MKLFLYFTFFFALMTQNAFAYIDPGGIGAIINVIIAGIAAGVFYIRSSIYQFISYFKNILKDLLIFIKFFKKKKSIVIYSENLQYLKYYGNLLSLLSLEEFNISLLINKKNDETEKFQHIDKFFINSSFLRNLSLNLLNCKILILTTPDIGNLYVKRSKFCKHYFYIFHSVVSTQMVYNKLAFQHYDSICCNGEYQFDELIQEEKKFNLPKKNLIKSGYPFFDKLKIENQNDYEKNKVLIAPSWNPSIPDYYEKYYSDIIDELLNENYNIIFRSHPEYNKRFLKNYEIFQDKYLSNKNVSFDTGTSLNEIFNSCEILITDWSGIAYEFVYSSRRTVIFNDIPLKKLNYDLAAPDEIFEYKFRDAIGHIFDNKKSITELIERIRKDRLENKKIDNFFKENFYNLGNSSKIILENLKKLSRDL